MCVCVCVCYDVCFFIRTVDEGVSAHLLIDMDENAWLNETSESIEAPHWDSLYKWQEKEKMDPYDCYINLKEWKDVLYPLLPKSLKRLLIVGCGHAPFSVDLIKDRGYDKNNIVNMDFSPTVIKSQKIRHPEFVWEIGDVRKLSYENNSFDIVLDKACADSLLECRDSKNELKCMFQEYRRVVRPGGRIIVLTKWFDQKNGDEGIRRKQYGQGPPSLLPHSINSYLDQKLILKCYETVLHRYKKRHRYCTMEWVLPPCTG